MTAHGGNIYRAAEELGMREEGIIDFSASINPLGVPRSVSLAIGKKIRELVHYPDPDTRRLTGLLGERLGIDPDRIVCGNGSTELIYLVVRAMKPRKVLVPAPTFAEYGRAVLQNINGKGGGNQTAILHLLLDAKKDFTIAPAEFIAAMAGDLPCNTIGGIHSTGPFDMAFLCNPNNPTGRLLKKKEVLKIAKAAEALRCHLVVDEAFIDFLPGESVIKEVGKNPYLTVLRSMTKFYALSGLRLGYGIFPPSVLEALREHKEPWTVNTLAQSAGIAALNDRAYSERTFRVIAREKNFLEKGLQRLGIAFVPSQANYYLFRSDRAAEIMTSLRRKGILVRDCSSFAGLDGSYIRIAVKSRRDNTLLLKELSQLCVA
jgi:threonine-phosphate decarboxylase